MKIFSKKLSQNYSAQDIEILEGLEAVRRRPAMYIGGTDEHEMHHLVTEILDNSMDEAVSGYASCIHIALYINNTIVISDNGRGIPTDPHPKFPDKSALEVLLTTLHSGGKFSNQVYDISGGLHGVGMSVVNGLSKYLRVEVCRDNKMVYQEYCRGIPKTILKNGGKSEKTQGTKVIFQPDPEIFGPDAKIKPKNIFQMARSKAYLYKGIKIDWFVEKSLIKNDDEIPQHLNMKFPNGIIDYLNILIKGHQLVIQPLFSGEAIFIDGLGRVEWSIGWTQNSHGSIQSFCNTIPTPAGGTHETGFRYALTKSIKAYGDMLHSKKSALITAEDVFIGSISILSVFITDPEFQGQTKEKLRTSSIIKLVESSIRDHFDHFLTRDTENANKLLNNIIIHAEKRNKRKEQKETKRSSPTRRLRLPGKLTDCSRSIASGTEIFLVEGDSASGSAKQARNRETQAILPLRGKILNVASATTMKMMANQEINDIIEAFGCGLGKNFNLEKLRYERIIIMTDADVDGAHITTLLMTFFYQEMQGIIDAGHLYLAIPPLYRLKKGDQSVYAMNDIEKDFLLKNKFKNHAKCEISRFKGLGEMLPQQLRDTTMSPKKRSLLRVMLPDIENNKRSIIKDLVNTLMGKKAELRFKFIQENARFIKNIDI